MCSTVHYYFILLFKSWEYFSSKTKRYLIRFYDIERDISIWWSSCHVCDISKWYSEFEHMKWAFPIVLRNLSSIFFRSEGSLAELHSWVWHVIGWIHKYCTCYTTGKDHVFSGQVMLHLNFLCSSNPLTWKFSFVFLQNLSS